jgi:hypothetical protein
MELALPVTTEPTVITYSASAMGIDTAPLAYYALSILWKGSVHEWTTLKGQKSSVDLGKYQEPIRCFLIGDAGFPDGPYVIVTACTDIGFAGDDVCAIFGRRIPVPDVLDLGERTLVSRNHDRLTRTRSRSTLLCSVFKEGGFQRRLYPAVPTSGTTHPSDGGRIARA